MARAELPFGPKCVNPEPIPPEVLLQVFGGALRPTISREGVTQPLQNNRKRLHPSSNVASPVLEKRQCTDDCQECNRLIPKITFSNVAGCTKILNEILQLVVHLKHPEIFAGLGMKPHPHGFLLHGPKGCGKTLIAQAVAGELKIPLIGIAAPDLGVSKAPGKLIRKVFNEALSVTPCVLLIDEIDAISTIRPNVHKDAEWHILSQLLLAIDSLDRHEGSSQVLLIGTASQPDALDPSLRRAGRFDKEVIVGIPDRDSRYEILKHFCSDLHLADDVSIDELAARTRGFVTADLLAFLEESVSAAVGRKVEELSANSVGRVILGKEDDKSTSEATIGINNEITATTKSSHRPRNTSVEIEKIKFIQMRSWMSNKTPVPPESLESLSVTKEDFDIAFKRVQQLYLEQKGFAAVPDVTWDVVGSLKDIKRQLLMMMLEEPVKYQNLFNKIGIPAGKGVLLCGPPGCGKALLAKAIANETGINFISVKGPDLLNMCVGKSDNALKDCFQRAKYSQPCILFLDELDALCPKRSNIKNGGTANRVMAQLFTEMDDFEPGKRVYLIAATNRPDIMDPAIMRAGRFDKVLYVGFPNACDRVDILKAILKKGTHLFGEDVDLEAIGKACKDYTGADLAALVKGAISRALYECDINNKPVSEHGPLLCAEHFNDTMKKIKLSVGVAERKYYEHMHQVYTTSVVSLRDEQNEGGEQRKNCPFPKNNC